MHADAPAVRAADFVSYFTSARRERLLNVVSLSLAGTPLEAQLCAPRVVRDADLVARAWPAGRGDSPAVQLYALASPAGCVTDWHLDFGGSSVWYYILAGSKVFALAPPTKPNMRAYVTWASSSRQMRQFLGDALQDVHKYTVHAGELLLIPGGWPHAVFTPEDSCVVGGNFVHAAGLGLQALVWRIEDRLRVEASFRYPNFKALCWYAALRFCDSLPAAADEGSAVARVERAGAKRLFIKLQKAVAKAKTAAADSGGEEEDDEGMAEEDEEAGDEDEEDEEEPPMAPKGDGLQHILNALTAAEEEQAVAPGSSAAPEPAEPEPATPFSENVFDVRTVTCHVPFAAVSVVIPETVTMSPVARPCAVFVRTSGVAPLVQRLIMFWTSTAVIAPHALPTATAMSSKVVCPACTCARIACSTQMVTCPTSFTTGPALPAGHPITITEVRSMKTRA